jgi:drug/metabolite transporter (DMT)-like permease
MNAGAEIGIGLALFAAFLTNLASLLKHRGCQCSHPISIKQPLRTARVLAGSRWFAIGWAVAAVAWLAHVAALSMAPISLVQAVLAGGAVLLAVMAQKLFGHPVATRQWVGLALGGAGLALLVLTVPRLGDSHSEFSLPAMIAFEGGLVAMAAGFAWGYRSDSLAQHGGVLLAATAGALFALAGIAIKALTGIDGAVAALVSPWLLVVVIAGVLAQYTAAASLQRGEAVAVIGLMGLVANAAQIAGGVLVFGDPLSPSPAGLALQGLAFVLVCGSAFLMPHPAARPAAATA